VVFLAPVRGRFPGRVPASPSNPCQEECDADQKRFLVIRPQIKESPMPASTERAPHKPTTTLSLPGKRAAAKPAAPAEHAGHDAGDLQKQVTPEKSPEQSARTLDVVDQLSRAISRKRRIS
jgi:hypothetical protein